MTPLAETSDIEASWRALDPVVEEPQAQRHLRYATQIVRKRFPTIDQRIANDDLDPQLVADVVAAMVVRYMRSHEGEARNDNQQRLEASEIALTDAEIALLEPTQIGELKRMGTIKVTPSLPYCEPLPYWRC